MECRDKIRIVVAAVASVAAISFVITWQYNSRRKLRKQKWIKVSCYLQSDQKPQNAFKRILADNSFSQFKHLKKTTDVQNDENENSSNISHPYEKEITKLIESNNGLEFGLESVNLKEMNDNEYIWIETESKLKELADTLCKERVFAVDTEQHSLRSFLGFTALIQISTQDQDYLLDTIALHDVMSILRPVFANPRILKVFHGADNDVLWLQRDFHIYAVNLFDTAKACEVLSKPQKSLAYLLELYCGVSTNKLLQREDWRQRPLSAEMLQYAQIDAHYLLYIASCLIAELKQQTNDFSSGSDDKLNFILEASRRSNMICLQLYAKEVEEFPGDSAASSLFSRHFNGQVGSSVSCEIQDLVRRLCTWRELMARVHDESLRYVLPDHAIVSLAEKVLTNPIEIYDTIAQADMNVDSSKFSSSSMPSPFPVVYSHFDDFCLLILESKENNDDIFLQLLQKCLGLNGSCLLSVYNYGLLVNCDLRMKTRSLLNKNGAKSLKQSSKTASRRELFVQKFSCKSPVYHNCRIYANDGRLLCYCDQRKLEWYLRRDLAKLVDEDPPAIMLLFEPKGRPEDEGNDFYIQSKKNICVGCGEGGHYLRYRIIPSCYRMHFPEHLKSHRSHDIVLLCVDCHEVSHAAAEKYKRHVAIEFGIPLFVRKVFESQEAPVIPGPSSSPTNSDEAGVSPLQLRTAAMALLRHGQKMPSKRREELIQIVSQYYGGREISLEDLEKALLVGMSPHERKRFEKKKGLSSKYSTSNILSNSKLVQGVTISQSSIENQSVIDVLDDLKTTNAKLPTDEEEKEKNLSCVMETDVVVSSDQLTVDASTTVSMDKNSTENDTDAYVDNGMQNRLVGLYGPTNDVNGELKSKSKVSLLGHGPHGKQVVQHILKEYGEDGIRDFCQRWRQVFVEAIHPRFLPAGWDVKHSGRRDFGEFSVYNPSNRVPDATS